MAAGSRPPRRWTARAALPYETPRPVTVTAPTEQPVKVRSELEIGRRLVFVLELIARGEVTTFPVEPHAFGFEGGRAGSHLSGLCAHFFRIVHSPPLPSAIISIHTSPASAKILSRVAAELS